MPRRKGRDAASPGGGTQRELNTDDVAVSRDRAGDRQKQSQPKQGRTARVDSRREPIIHRGERYKT